MDLACNLYFNTKQKYYKPKAAKSEEERLAYNQKKKEQMRRRRTLAKSTRELEKLKETGMLHYFEMSKLPNCSQFFNCSQQSVKFLRFCYNLP